MGGIKKGLKKSFNFTKKVYGGGYVRDMIKNPKKGFSGAVNDASKAFGGKKLIKDGGSGLDGINGLMEEATAEQQRLQALQTAAGIKGLNAIKPAYAAARKNVQVGKASSAQSAMDIGQQMQSQAQQSMAARGLYNSTVMDNARMGISSQTTRDLADIDASYAQLLAQLDIGEGQATTQANQYLSGMFGQQASSVAGLKMNQAQLAASMYEDPDQWLDNLLGIGTTLGAAYLTGGGSLFASGASGAVLKSGSSGVAPGTGPLLDWEG